MGPPAEGRVIVRETAKPRRGLVTGTALLLVVPVFGNGTEGPTTVSLLALTGVSPWVRAVFSACVGATVICGLCELAASRVDGRWGKAALAAGVALSAACVAVFILTRQPYAGITCFALLAAKAVMLWMRDC